ncbi:response regulator [Archangium sp.]|uniref:response regulator n=1 Tax=Archangium sp. TaxID=1872627 RepID=UPI00286A756A|nr:response regulator [Archangium sp.]
MADPSNIILLVEDETDVREAIEEVLVEHGCQVMCVTDGAQALEWLARGQRPSLVLLDFVMPEMSGWTFLERMRADPALGDVPVVAISALAVAHPRVSAALRKPFDLPSLLRMVDRFAPCSGEGAPTPGRDWRRGAEAG